MKNASRKICCNFPSLIFNTFTFSWWFVYFKRNSDARRVRLGSGGFFPDLNFLSIELLKLTWYVFSQDIENEAGSVSSVCNLDMFT
jgi:hypothetical protein